MPRINRERIKKCFPWLAKLVKWAKRRKNEMAALPRHISRKMRQAVRHSKQEKIKVAFVCQYIPAWSKNKQLYEALKTDDRFEPILLCIPNRISANLLNDPDDMSNDVYEYFIEHGYKNAVNALIGKDKWFDIKEAQVDYVIYNRYDRPMPIQYTSKVVSTHAKVCLIEYGTSLLKMVDQMFDHHFVANTYCYFAESKAKQKEFLRWNRILRFLRLSRAEFCGIPAVENAYMASNDDAPAWAFSKNEFRAIYAPRWTTDPVWGGSSFFKYSSFFFELADDHPEMDILIRPHPLMFANFVETGLMTAGEVDQLEKECINRQNVRMDKEQEYLSSFWKSSVLICDFSSMIIEYYITKKPIIYLTYNENIEYTDQMLAMLKGCYIVNDDNELKNTVEMLLSGEDPLATVRDRVCRTALTSGDNLKASENMKQVLLNGNKK